MNPPNPSGRRTLTQRLCLGVLRLAGWRLNYLPPPGPKAVAIVYPHTSNWDFPLGVLAKGAMGLPFHWVGKDNLFKGLFGLPDRFFRALGGVPVNRREATGFVGQMVREFRERESFYLALAPEGTRSLRPGWKSGFYHLTLAADVPLLLAWLDFGTKEVGVCHYLTLTGDQEADMAAIRAAYEGKRGLRPELQTPIQLLRNRPDGDGGRPRP